MTGGFFVVVALGDSLTAGFQNPSPGNPGGLIHPYVRDLHNLMWRRVRELGLDVSPVVEVESEVGSSTRGMLRRFDAAVPRHGPDAVLAWGGINDLTSGVPAEQAAANLRAIMEKTRPIGAEPVLLTLSPVEGDERIQALVHEYNAAYRRLAEELGVQIVDVYAPLAEEDGALRPEYSNDGTHLTDKGYAEVGETVFREAVKPKLRGAGTAWNPDSL